MSLHSKLYLVLSFCALAALLACENATAPSAPVAENPSSSSDGPSSATGLSSSSGVSTSSIIGSSSSASRLSSAGVPLSSAQSSSSATSAASSSSTPRSSASVPSSSAMVSSSSLAPTACTGKSWDSAKQFCDERDGRLYKFIEFQHAGSNIRWMAQNLAWLPRVHAPGDTATSQERYYVYGYDGTDTAAAKTFSNGTNVSYATYGVLYNQKAAKSACPAGWNLASEFNWSRLTTTAETHMGNGGTMLKSVTGWKYSTSTNQDRLGFSALPGGLLSSPSGFRGLAEIGTWWTSSGEYISMDYNYPNVAFHMSANHPADAFSVRCQQFF